MTRLRKLILLIFIGAYLGVAPLTILYALGFIFNPGRQTLVQTGLVSLASEPAGAVVSVDGFPSEDKTPVVLRNLSPGVHEVQINLPAYHSWHKQIRVIPERVLRFENVLLFPSAFDEEVVGNFPISNLWHVPAGKYILTLEGETAGGLSLFDPAEKKFLPLASKIPYPDAKVVQVFLHPDGDRARLILQGEKILIPPFIKWTAPAGVLDVSGVFHEPFEQITWDPYQKNSLFYLQGKTLQKINLERGIVYPPLSEKITGYTLHKGRLYALDQENRFLELSEKGKVQEVLLDDASRARLIFGPDQENPYQISFLSNSSVFFIQNEAVALFLSKKGRLFCNKLPYFLDEGVDELVTARSELRAAYRKGEELWTVDLQREEEKAFFEAGPRPRRIHKGKESLAHILWSYNDQYVFFLEGPRVMVQDYEGGEDAVELFKISKQVKKIILDSPNGFLYFAEPGGHRLARVKIHTPAGLIPRLMDDFAEAGKEPS